MRNALLIILGIAIMALAASVVNAEDCKTNPEEGLKCKGEEAGTWGSRPGRGEILGDEGFNKADYKGYEDDPLFKKLVELEEKIVKFAKEYVDKIKAIEEKYGDFEKMSDEDKLKMQAEIMKVSAEKRALITEFDNTKAELDEKVAEERELKYKDDPLYKKMKETKAKYDEAYKVYKEKMKELTSPNHKAWKDMTEDEQTEYKTKIVELQEAVRNTKDEYLKAKLAFLKSIDSIDNEEKEDGKDEEKKNNSIEGKSTVDQIKMLEAELEQMKKMYEELMAASNKEMKNMNEEQKKQALSAIEALMNKIMELEKQIKELTEKAN